MSLHMQVTYDDGARTRHRTQHQAPAVFIAKFLNPDASFAFFRWALGSTGTSST
jgi:hypothetical protein